MCYSFYPVICSAWWCPLRFPHTNDVRSVLTPSCCRGAYVLYILCVFARVWGFYHYLNIWVTWWKSYKDFLSLRVPAFTPIFSGVRIAHLFWFVCFLFSVFLFSLSSFRVLCRTPSVYLDYSFMIAPSVYTVFPLF